MKLYSATVLLSGSKDNQVLKHDLTAAEIVVLKRMHGGEAVIAVTHSGDNDRSEVSERARLQDIYGNGLRTIQGVHTLEALLGPAGVPLPKIVEGVEHMTKGKPKKDAPAEAAAPEPINQDEFA